MPVARSIQENLSGGILFKSAASLGSLGQYAYGMANAVNVSITPLGSLRVRSGWRKIYDSGNLAYDVPNNFWVSKNSFSKIYGIFGSNYNSRSAINVVNLDTGQFIGRTALGSFTAKQNEPLYVIISQDAVLTLGIQAKPYIETDTIYQPVLVSYLGDDVRTSHFVVFEAYIRYTQKVNGVDTDFEYYVENYRIDNGGFITAMTFYNDRLLFAVGNKILGSAVGEYLLPTDSSVFRKVVFRRPAKEGEVVMHEGSPLTISINDIGDALPTDSIETTLSGRADSTIFDLRSQNGLYAFTKGGIFYTPEALLQPTNFFLQAVSEEDIKEIIPSAIDNNFVFIRQSEGAPEAVIEYEQIFQGESYGFNAVELSILVDGLVVDVKSIATTKGTDKDSMQIIYFLHKDGERIYCLHVNKNQKIAGWTIFDNAEIGKIQYLAAYENRLFAMTSNEGGIYELDGDNAAVEWEIELLRPRIRLERNSPDLFVSGWRYVRSYIEVREAAENMVLKINDKEISMRHLDIVPGVRSGVYESSVQGVNHRRSGSLARGARISGVGGGNLTIDRISFDVEYSA